MVAGTLTSVPLLEIETATGVAAELLIAAEQFSVPPGNTVAGVQSTETRSTPAPTRTETEREESP